MQKFMQKQAKAIFTFLAINPTGIFWRDELLISGNNKPPFLLFGPSLNIFAAWLAFYQSSHKIF